MDGSWSLREIHLTPTRPALTTMDGVTYRAGYSVLERTTAAEEPSNRDCVFCRSSRVDWVLFCKPEASRVGSRLLKRAYAACGRCYELLVAGDNTHLAAVFTQRSSRPAEGIAINIVNAFMEDFERAEPL